MPRWRSFFTQAHDPVVQSDSFLEEEAVTLQSRLFCNPPILEEIHDTHNDESCSFPSSLEPIDCLATEASNMIEAKLSPSLISIIKTDDDTACMDTEMPDTQDQLYLYDDFTRTPSLSITSNCSFWSRAKHICYWHRIFLSRADKRLSQRWRRGWIPWENIFSAEQFKIYTIYQSGWWTDAVLTQNAI